MPEENFTFPPGFHWQYHVLLWMQRPASPVLDRVAVWVSHLGVEWFYMVAVPVVLWSVNRIIGLRLAYIFICSMFVNAWLKDVYQVARPMGVPGIRSSFLESASGHSFPSGHAQGSLTFWGVIACWVRRAWLWWGAMALVLAMGLARLYLGLHWPVDVLAGWALGLVFVVGGWFAGRWWTYRKLGFRLRLAFAIGVPAALYALHPLQPAGGYAAMLLGLGVGAVLEERWLGLDLQPEWWKRACAGVIGIAGMIALQWLVKWPQGLWVWPLARGVLLGLWAALGAPYVFWLCGLYRRASAA